MLHGRGCLIFIYSLKDFFFLTFTRELENLLLFYEWFSDNNCFILKDVIIRCKDWIVFIFSEIILFRKQIFAALNRPAVSGTQFHP